MIPSTNWKKSRLCPSVVLSDCGPQSDEVDKNLCYQYIHREAVEVKFLRGSYPVTYKFIPVSIRHLRSRHSRLTAAACCEQESRAVFSPEYRTLFVPYLSPRVSAGYLSLRAQLSRSHLCSSRSLDCYLPISRWIFPRFRQRFPRSYLHCPVLGPSVPPVLDTNVSNCRITPLHLFDDSMHTPTLASESSLASPGFTEFRKRSLPPHIIESQKKEALAMVTEKDSEDDQSQQSQQAQLSFFERYFCKEASLSGTDTGDENDAVPTRKFSILSRGFVTVAALLCLIIVVTLCAVLATVFVRHQKEEQAIRRSPVHEAIFANFADPVVVKHEGLFYAFATTNAAGKRTFTTTA